VTSYWQVTEAEVAEIAMVVLKTGRPTIVAAGSIRLSIGCKVTRSNGFCKSVIEPQETTAESAGPWYRKCLV